MSLNNGMIFFFCPSFFLYFRIKVIMPSLSTLLAYSSWQMLCNESPIPCTMFQNKSSYFLIFIGCLHFMYNITHGPLISLGFNTFCHLCRHCTSVRSLKELAILFQFFAPYSSTNFLSCSSSSVVHHLFLGFSLSWL